MGIINKKIMLEIFLIVIILSTNLIIYTQSLIKL